jgi:hypothetical protein
MGAGLSPSPRRATAPGPQRVVPSRRAKAERPHTEPVPHLRRGHARARAKAVCLRWGRAGHAMPAPGPRLRAGAARAGRRAERDEGEGCTGGLEGESERNGEEMGHGLRASWARDDREAVGGARRRRGTGTRVRPGGWDPPTGGSDAPARAR